MKDDPEQAAGLESWPPSPNPKENSGIGARTCFLLGPSPGA